MLGSGLWVAALLVGVSSVVCVLASLLGLTGGASLLGLLAVGFTYTVFQLYYAISRGVGDASRAAIAYVCASAAQLILLVALSEVLEPTPGLALFAYGASSVLPVLAFELRRPLIRGRALSVRRVELDRIWKLSAPLVLAQAGFVVWFSVDQIWIESALTTEDVGLYGAAKTLSQVFLVLPAGVTGVLLPRVAELRTAGDAVRARRLVYWATLGSMLISGLLALAVVLSRTELLEAVFGDRYGAASDSLTGLAVAMVLYTGFMTLANAAVGWGRPAVYTIGMVVTALAQLACLALIWDDQVAAAAWASAISMGIGFLVVLGILVARQLQGSLGHSLTRRPATLPPPASAAPSLRCSPGPNRGLRAVRATHFFAGSCSWAGSPSWSLTARHGRSRVTPRPRRARSSARTTTTATGRSTWRTATSWTRTAAASS